MKNPLLLLTYREREVALLLARGLSYEAIAVTLGITHETVKKHTQHIYKKLHVKNKVQAILKLRII